MKIGGIQKLTTLDYPGKIACTIFMHGCNFKCGFCHNPELVVGEFKEGVSETEVISFLEKRRQYLEGVCISGGEPLIKLNLDFLRKIRSMGYFIKIDTNGSLPDRLEEVFDFVDFVAMDIKSSRDKYSWVTNSGIDTELIEKSIKLVADSNLEYEFRTTVVAGIHDVLEIARIGMWLNEVLGRKPKKYVLQGFKNQGKFVDMRYKFVPSIKEDFLKELKAVAEEFFEEVEIRV